VAREAGGAEACFSQVKGVWRCAPVARVQCRVRAYALCGACRCACA